MSNNKKSSKHLAHTKKLIADAREHEINLLANYEAVRKMRTELESEVLAHEGHNQKIDAIRASNNFLKDAREALHQKTE